MTIKKIKRKIEQKNKSGFTLIEVVIALAIIVLIVSLAIIIDLNALKGNTLLSEQVKIVSILGKARSRAMANMSESKHGVCYISPNYIIFQGNTCNVSGSELIPANISIASNPSTIFPSFVFTELSGNTIGDTIHLEDGIKSKDITINNEGTINW